MTRRTTAKAGCSVRPARVTKPNRAVACSAGLIAGTAELSGYDRDLNRVRCEAIVRRVEELFPGAGDTERAQFWTGLRPATPSNAPLIGRSKVKNLFLNTGHGTLGWTHACGSGKSIARIVSGLQPEVNFAFTGLSVSLDRPQQLKPAA